MSIQSEIEKLKPGDSVAIYTRSEVQPYIIGKVEKFTATQVTISGQVYMMTTGIRKGDADSYAARQEIAYNKGRLMTIAQATRINEEIKADRDLTALVRQIKDAPVSRLKELPPELIRQIIEALVEDK